MKKDNNKITDYLYHNIDGKVLYIKRRIDNSDGCKEFVFLQPDGTKGLQNIQHVPYNVHNVAKAEKSDVIFFVEGEKCAESLIKQGYTATTLDCGANSSFDDKWIDYFKDKTVIIIPDNDAAGLKYASKLKKSISWAVIKVLPDLAEKEDVYDWIEKGHDVSEIFDLPEYVEESETTIDIPSCGRSQSEKLLYLIQQEKLSLFLNEDHNPYAEIVVDKHKEIIPVESRNFELWAQQLFYNSEQKPIRAENLKQAISVIVAKCVFSGLESTTLYNRVAYHEGCFWYDLTSPDWKAIKISKTGWTVEKDIPRLFYRYNHQKTQVVPQSTDNAVKDIDRIFKYINLSEYPFLFISWLVSCFVPDIPHPMTIFYGEKGAAKSTSCVLLKKLIDPSVMDTVTLRNDERSLLVNFQHHYYLPFDNVSSISSEISDNLCRAITGGASAPRKLFTDSDEYIFTFLRCLSINGISNVANRADLLDRSILFELNRVSEDARMELKEVYDNFEKDRPYILGAIFTLLSSAMKIYPTVALKKLPRMADFCRWGYAIAEATGKGNGEVFLTEYNCNMALQNNEAVNSDAVAYLITELMRFRESWYGRMSDLLVALQEKAKSEGMNPNAKALPSAPNALSRRVKSVKSNLKEVGITFTIETKHDGSYITLNNTVDISKLSKNHLNVNDLMRNILGDKFVDNQPTGELPPLIKPGEYQLSGDNGDNCDNIDDDDDDEIEF